MRARNITRLRIIAGVTLAAAVFGAVLPRDFAPLHLAINAAAGGLGGLVLTLFEIALQGPCRAALKNLPVWLVFLGRMIVYGAVFRAATPVALAAYRVFGPASGVSQSALQRFSFTDSIVLALLFNTVFTARALMGQRTLIAFLTGRYHRPRQEERVVLFLDLHGSTGLAERLGDRQFHSFLNRMFSDLADPVAEAAGEIYRYIGDEIIITWIIRNGGESAAALGCLFEIEDLLRQRRAEYEAEFGEAPLLRGGLHAGPVIIGEMGAFKREIVMLGDTMNTASRIVESCRSTGRDFIASAAALHAATPLPPQICVESLGPLPLRGKEERIELYALGRQHDAARPAISAAMAPSAVA